MTVIKKWKHQNLFHVLKINKKINSYKNNTNIFNLNAPSRLIANVQPAYTLEANM